MIDLSGIHFKNLNITYAPDDESFLATIIDDNGVFAGFGPDSTSALNAAVERQKATDPEHGLITRTMHADEIADHG